MFATARPSMMAALALFVLGVAGCATPPPASDPDAVAEFNATNDPLEPTNRVIYAVNDGFDVVFLRPLALVYRNVVPDPVQRGVHNILANANTPVVLANDMLQGKPRRAGDSLMRLTINTTLGVGGIFDVATGMGYPSHEADFGITLGVWGVGPGPYLFLPFFGPSNPRDALGKGVDFGLDPLTYTPSNGAIGDAKLARFGAGALDARAAVLDDLDRVKAQALDPYATIRSASRQYRKTKIDEAKAAK